MGTLKLVVHTLDMRETRSGVCGSKEEKKIEKKKTLHPLDGELDDSE